MKTITEELTVKRPDYPFFNQELAVAEYNPRKYSIERIDGYLCYIYGETQKDRNRDILFIRKTIIKEKFSLLKQYGLGFYSNHNYISKIVSIDGKDVLTIGKTEEIRQQDEAHARLHYSK